MPRNSTCVGIAEKSSIPPASAPLRSVSPILRTLGYEGVSPTPAITWRFGIVLPPELAASKRPRWRHRCRRRSDQPATARKVAYSTAPAGCRHPGFSQIPDRTYSAAVACAWLRRALRCSPNILPARVVRRRFEAPELALDQVGKGDRGAIFEIRPDDLNTDRQIGFRTINWCNSRGKPRCRRNSRPNQLVEIGVLLAVDFNMSGPHRRRMIVGKGRGRHRWAEHSIPFAKEFAPLPLEPGARHIGRQPVAMARDGPADAVRP